MKSTFLWTLSLGLLLSCSNQKTSEVAATPVAPIADTPAAVHGMVLFGTDQLYASHIPMYMVPHDWQALFKVKISNATQDAFETYTKANVGSKQVYFTIAPKPFVLPRLLDGRITSFKADLYKGSFETGGRKILSNITVDVEQVVYKQHLSKSSASLDALTYLSVEAGSSSYLAHQITAPNNFDHIVQIQWIKKPATGLPLEETPVATPLDPSASNEIALEPIVSPALDVAVAQKFQLSDDDAERLEAGDYFTVEADGTIAPAASAASASFRVVSDFYCTQGPDFYNPCN